MSLGTRGWAVSLGALCLFLAGQVGLASAQCVGDCNGDHSVSAAEVSDAVQIALLDALPETCPAYGPEVEVDHLVVAVNNKIHSCPATPTPTATVTPTNTATPLPTNTPGGVSNAVAGGAAVVAKSLSGIPSLVTAIVTGLTRGGSSQEAIAPGEGGGAGACPLGGTATRMCSQNGLAAHLELGLDDCAVSTPDGSLTLDAVVPISLDAQFGQCPSLVVPPINAIADVRGAYKDSEGTTTLNTRSTLTAVVQAISVPNPTPVCVVSGLDLTVTGTLSSKIPDNGGAILNFFQASVDLDIETFNNDCVPVEYTLTFNGPAEVSDTSTMEKAAIDFDDLVVHVDARSSPTTLEMSGGLNFDCVAGAITLDTISPLAAIPGTLCPTAGTLAIGSPEGPAKIRYSETGVEIDIDDDGTFDNIFSSCIDPMLQLCPES